MGLTSCAKRCMLACDVFCTLLALVLIAFGVYILCAYEINEVVTMTTYAYIGIGVATLVIILFGLIGTLRKNVCCTVTFIIFLIALIIAQVAVVFLLTQGQKSVASNFAKTMDETWEIELLRPGVMAQYESWLDCCGRASPQDYIVNGVLPPPSCYKDQDDTFPTNLSAKGCRVAFEDYWINLLHIFNIIAWILIGFELTGSIISCVFCNNIRNEQRRSYY